jgi:putative ABC transport system permease protein
MKYLPLLWSGLWRKRARTLLTLLSVTTAFLLYGILNGVTSGFDDLIARFADASGLRMQNRVGATSTLPIAYLPQIESVPGVTAVAPYVYFGGYYCEQENGIDAAAVHFDRFGALTSDVIISDDELATVQRTRTGAIVGSEVLETYGWNIGDRITLKSFIWNKKDGSRDWEFDIVGSYSLREGAYPENDGFWFNYDYLDEGRERLAGTVTMYRIKVDDPDNAAQIAERIDVLFRNSADETLTQTESDFIRAQIDRVGDINFIVNAIVGAVLFTILFLTGNTMMQSIRERIPELAILKTYGFGNGAIMALVAGESLLLCLAAAALGLGLAAAVFPSVYESLGVAALPLQLNVILAGAGIAVALALVSALPPVWRVQRLKIVDALAGR